MTSLSRDPWQPPTTEQEARVELAIAYRAAAMFGWTDLGSTHFSARVPGEPDAYLMLQRGCFFHEVTASNLVKVGFDGELRSESTGAPQPELNRAGVAIHGSLHAGRADLGAVMHTHSAAGIAVACHPDGLLGLSQHALRFYARQGVHPFEGIADDDEGPRLIEHLGDNELLLLPNHGIITVGSSVPTAFSALYYAETSAQIQVAVLSSTETPVVPPDDVCEHTAKQYEAWDGYQYQDWMGIVRLVERDHPDHST